MVGFRTDVFLTYMDMGSGSPLQAFTVVRLPANTDGKKIFVSIKDSVCEMRIVSITNLKQSI